MEYAVERDDYRSQHCTPFITALMVAVNPETTGTNMGIVIGKRVRLERVMMEHARGFRLQNQLKGGRRILG